MNEKSYLPETTRVEEFWGHVSTELLYWNEDALRCEINYGIKVRVDYDLQNIENYVLEGLKPLTWKDIPETWQGAINYYGKDTGTKWYMNEPVTLFGKRLYVVDGDMKHWEYKKLYEMRYKDDGK